MRSRLADILLRSGLVWLSAFLLMSCASTQMTSTWKDPNYAGGPLKKIAIFVVEKDESLRRIVEDQVVRSLLAGARAVPSYTMFPVLEKDKEKIKSRLIADNFDGALVGRLAAIVRDETYRAPQTYVVGPGPFGMDPGGSLFDQYYQSAYSYAYDPGYLKEDAKYFVEAVLYKLPEGKPIWKATSESMNPSSSTQLVADVTRLVERELQKENLVGGP